MADEDDTRAPETEAGKTETRQEALPSTNRPEPQEIPVIGHGKEGERAVEASTSGRLTGRRGVDRIRLTWVDSPIPAAGLSVRTLRAWLRDLGQMEEDIQALVRTDQDRSAQELRDIQDYAEDAHRLFTNALTHVDAHIVQSEQEIQETAMMFARYRGMEIVNGLLQPALARAQRDQTTPRPEVDTTVNALGPRPDEEVPEGTGSGRSTADMSVRPSTGSSLPSGLEQPPQRKEARPFTTNGTGQPSEGEEVRGTGGGRSTARTLERPSPSNSLFSLNSRVSMEVRDIFQEELRDERRINIELPRGPERPTEAARRETEQLRQEMDRRYQELDALHQDQVREMQRHMEQMRLHFEAEITAQAMRADCAHQQKMELEKQLFESRQTQDASGTRKQGSIGRDPLAPKWPQPKPRTDRKKEDALSSSRWTRKAEPMDGRPREDHPLDRNWHDPHDEERAGWAGPNRNGPAWGRPLDRHLRDNDDHDDDHD